MILNLLFYGFGLSSGYLKIILVLYTMPLHALSFYRHIFTLTHVKKNIKLVLEGVGRVLNKQIKNKGEIDK